VESHKYRAPRDKRAPNGAREHEMNCAPVTLAARSSFDDLPMTRHRLEAR
jgi:hypothetical protein